MVSHNTVTMKLPAIFLCLIVCRGGTRSVEDFVAAETAEQEEAKRVVISDILKVSQSLEEIIDNFSSVEDRVFGEMKRVNQLMDSLEKKLLLYKVDDNEGSQCSQSCKHNITGSDDDFNDEIMSIGSSFDFKFEAMSLQLNETTDLLKDCFHLQTQMLSLFKENKNNCSSGEHATRARKPTQGVTGSGNQKNNEAILPEYTRPDLATNGSGWLLIQRRTKGDVDFERNWTDYKVGFGNLTGDFWMGNDHIHNITTSGKFELRVDLTVKAGPPVYAVYNRFYIDSESANYTMHLGNYTDGNAGDSFSYHNGMPFATKDWRSNKCPLYARGGWWYNDCYRVNLNMKITEYEWYFASWAGVYGILGTELRIRRIEK